MPRSSRPVRWFAAGCAAAASAWSAWPLTAAEIAGPAPSAYTYRTPAGEEYFAVAVRASLVEGAHRPADRHVVLVDTSASQVGEHRDRALAVTEALLASLPESAAVSLYAVDTGSVPLTDGFVPARSAAAADAMTKLRRRAPLGATDLAGGLSQAAGAFGDEPAGSVVYIGDGMSAGNLLRTGELKSLADAFRSRRVPVHGYAVGPDTDWRLLGALAHQTGGVVEVDGTEVKESAPADIGRRLAEAAAAPVLYPAGVAGSGEARFATGDAVPPLRTDRETILLGRGPLPAVVRVTAGGDTLAFSASKGRTADGQAAVRVLAQAAERTGGLDMPAAGTDLLALAGATVEAGVERLTETTRRASAAGRVDDVDRLLVALNQADPAAATRVRQTVAQADADGPAFDRLAQGPAPAPPLAAGDADLLGAALERERILTQQLTVETNARIDEARLVRQTDPADALNLLRRFENQVRLAADIDPEVRRQLLRRLNNEILTTANMQEKLELDLVLRQERLARVEAEERLVDRLVREEERLEQLIDRVRALMNEGYHGDDAAFEEAIITARDALALRPGAGTPTAALFTAVAADQLNKMYALVQLREDRWLETLYQAELSAVPFPDEPPIVYPPPEVWQALTERRRKYASVSLETTSPAEERIRAALGEETVLEFPNTPLSDALAFLADYHNITILPDDDALQEEGISVEDPINIVISGVSLRSALDIILEPLNLTYVIEDEVMKITTQSRADEQLSTRVYPVGDLVIPIITPQAGGVGQGMGGAGGLGGQGQGGGQFGGGQGGGGGGLGGAGQFSVPDPNLPAAEQRKAPPKRDRRNVPQAPPQAKPIDDAELRGLLDGVLKNGDETSRVEPAGQAFAAVSDEVAPADGKKKA